MSKTPHKAAVPPSNKLSEPAQPVSTERAVEPKREEVPEGKREEINKEIADHEKWMSEHTDDARGVQERLQQIELLQAKLAELDAPKLAETRVRQTHL